MVGLFLEEVVETLDSSTVTAPVRFFILFTDLGWCGQWQKHLVIKLDGNTMRKRWFRDLYTEGEARGVQSLNHRF